MILRLSFILYCFIFIQLNHGVDVDYFLRSGLRSDTEVKCSSKMGRNICQLQCGDKSALCFKEQCYCVTFTAPKEDEIEEPETKRSNVGENDSQEKLENALLFNDKAILRHHIAHFCPNLDVARACIRTCMKEGKPAFCGKDHVCYCGHRYSSTDKDPNVNVSKIYADFKDMYEKYFGPNYRPEINA